MELLAVALICAAATPMQDCSRTTAVDVAVSRVAMPMDCAMRGQAMIAGGPLGDRVGGDHYVKVVCERQGTRTASRD